eukprot:NODE_573_length_1524_cov_242.778305_g433_i0.p1 GENE.NODE_573_length_1524_cov_242.778305_g433_i0~~NODE_573_length_1524_cov_242.778305_g433_i0.p1  ORF type:complete len:480 (+),score=112.52 NODE_573_length_1524_cov_242.778305_g433_i0:53-1441(+)
MSECSSPSSPSPTYGIMKGHGLLMVSVFIALYCDYVLNAMGVPILPSFLAKLHIKEFHIGILFASKPATQIFGNTAAGMLVDKRGAKPVLLLGLVVLSISTAVFGVALTWSLSSAATYALLLSARCVQGISSAAIMSAGMSWIARAVHPSQRGSVMGIVLVGIGAGAVSGASLGGVLASIFGNASPFYCIALLLVVDITLLLTQSDDRHRSTNSSSSSMQQSPAGFSPSTPEKVGGKKRSELAQVLLLLRDRNILCINVLLFTANAGMTVLQPTLPLFVERHFGYQQFGQGVMWAWMTFTYLVCRPLAGLLSDRMEKWRVTCGGVFCLGGGLCVMGLGWHIEVLLAGVCLVGSGVAFITTPCMPLLADIVELHGSQGYGVVYASCDISTSFGMIVGPLLGSALSGFMSFGATCHIAGLSSLLSVGCSLSLRRIGIDRNKLSTTEPPPSLPSGNDSVTTTRCS